jgi:hypothetical protein
MRSVCVVYFPATEVVLLLKLGGNEVLNPAKIRCRCYGKNRISSISTVPHNERELIYDILFVIYLYTEYCLKKRNRFSYMKFAPFAQPTTEGTEIHGEIKLYAGLFFTPCLM